MGGINSNHFSTRLISTKTKASGSVGLGKRTCTTVNNRETAKNYIPTVQWISSKNEENNKR